jgi:hypothetical protein
VCIAISAICQTLEIVYLKREKSVICLTFFYLVCRGKYLNVPRRLPSPDRRHLKRNGGLKLLIVAAAVILAITFGGTYGACRGKASSTHCDVVTSEWWRTVAAFSVDLLALFCRCRCRLGMGDCLSLRRVSGYFCEFFSGSNDRNEDRWLIITGARLSICGQRPRLVRVTPSVKKERCGKRAFCHPSLLRSNNRLSPPATGIRAKLACDLRVRSWHRPASEFLPSVIDFACFTCSHFNALFLSRWPLGGVADYAEMLSRRP